MKHFAIALIAAATLSTQAVAQARVKNVYASSQKLNMELLQDQSQTVQLNRYLFAGYNTLCLPMSMSTEQLQAVGLRAERMAAVRQEGQTVEVCFVDCTSEGIQAGVPYLVYSPSAQYLRVKTAEALHFATDLKSVTMSDGQGNQVTFSSSWETIQKNGRYGIPAKQDVTPLESVLIRTEADKAFLPTRCGFNWDQQSETASELKISHVSQQEATAIRGLQQGSVQQGSVYDLNGRKMNGQLRKGIYVVDGEKVVR